MYRAVKKFLLAAWGSLFFYAKSSLTRKYNTECSVYTYSCKEVITPLYLVVHTELPIVQQGKHSLHQYTHYAYTGGVSTPLTINTEHHIVLYITRHAK